MERDVELALLSTHPAEARLSLEIPSSSSAFHLPSSYRTQPRVNEDEEDPGDSDADSTDVEKGADATQDSQAISNDDDYIRLPRRKVEQLMGMWIEVLQQSLQAKNSSHDVLALPRKRSRGSLPQFTPSMSISRYPPVSYPPNSYPWATVKPMAQFEREAEDGWRRMGRSMWKTPENLAHLEDSWKYLWEPMVGVDKGLFQWHVDEETRKTLQYNLVDALNANERIVSANMFMRRDYRTISTFITLIGLRLNDQYRSYHRLPEMGPVKQVHILIECIWACNAFDPSNDIRDGYREGPRLSNVLTACYRRGVLPRPEEGFDDYVTMAVLKKHCQAVRRALHLINLLQKHQISIYMQCETLSQARELWSMPLPDVEAPLLHLPYRSSTLRDGTDAFLRIDDFNLRDLQTLGHLQIQWTSYWDEHLQLETNSTANMLKIYWFQPKLARYLVENHLCSQLSSNELTRREDELFRTWCLIFTSKTRPRQSIAQYKSLRAPRWLSLLGHTKLSTWTPEQATNNAPDSGPLLSKFISPSPSSFPSFAPSTPSPITTTSSPSNIADNAFTLEPPTHLLLQWSRAGKKLPHERISYAQFPIYGDRLRELRTYMDSQQPTGLRALWKDRRNSSAYYTFWFVTVFGSASVLLAAAALAVGIAQTWAAFRALEG